MKSVGSMIVALALASAGTAHGAMVPNPPAVRPALTYDTADQVALARTFGAFSGVGSLFVSTVSTATTNLGSLCTGSLVASNVVLTAGHCLSDYTPEGVYDPVTSVTFYLPSAGERTAANTYTATTWQVNPGYTGDLLNGNDLALFTLGSAAQGHDVYSLFGGDPLQAFTRVGTGTTGGPDGTGTGVAGFDFDQRAGNNLYEYFGDDVFYGANHNILMSDFDDGSAVHDAFGRAGGNAQTGILGESDSSPGDSGGPEFINGQIVGVTSFGVTGAVFDGECGLPTDIDPSASAAGQCTNSSIGELAGDTWLLPYRSFIESYVAAAPEPETWATMILGLGAIGGLLRRARARLRRAAGDPHLRVGLAAD